MSEVVYGGMIRRGDLTDAAFTLRVARTKNGFDIFTPDAAGEDYLEATGLSEGDAREMLTNLKVRDIAGMNPGRLIGTMLPRGKEYDFKVTSSRIGLQRVLTGGASEK